MRFVPAVGQLLAECVPSATNAKGGYLGILALLLAALALNGGAYAQAAFNLTRGWNLLGNTGVAPVDVVTTFGSPSATVPGVTPSIVSVWKWDAATQSWYVYSPHVTAAQLTAIASSRGYQVLSTIGPGEGYWVNTTSAVTLPAQSGTEFYFDFTRFAALPSSWNLLATATSQSPHEFSNAVSSLAAPASGVNASFLSLWAWDAAQWTWYYYAPALENIPCGSIPKCGLPGVKAYAESRGYLHFEDTNKKLGRGVGFWLNIGASSPAPVGLAIGGSPFRFVGGFVPGWHWGADTWSQSTDDDLVLTARESGMTVLHVMLPWFETSLGVYDEAELVKLDHFLDSAYRNNVHVLPAFIQGMGIAIQSNNPYYHPHGIEGLITDPLLDAAFLNRIEHLVTRRNSVNQRLYRDDPTILGWIIIDEPISAPWNYPGGAPDVSAAALNAWLGRIAAFIKSLDPNHLVTVFTTAGIDALGEDWLQALNVPTLDFIYAEDAELRILDYFYPNHFEAASYPRTLLTLNKPLVMMLSFTSGAFNQESICSDYAWQGQMLGAASSRYFEVGASGVTVFLWGSDRYPFVPSFDRCFTYTDSNQSVTQYLREVAQSVNPRGDPRPPLGFVGVR